MSKVHVVEYDPEWRRIFERIRDYVWPAVFDVAIDVEHVGSTSVPALMSKPVIDACIVVASSREIHTCIERLASIGYVHRGNLRVPEREPCCNQEHQPVGQFAARHGRTAAPLNYTPLGDFSPMLP